MYNEPQGKRFQFLAVKRMALHVLMSGIRAKDPVFVVVLKAAKRGEAEEYLQGEDMAVLLMWYL